jgi:hypothetical protein
VAPARKPDFSDMKKADLIKYALDNSIDIPDDVKKKSAIREILISI